MVCVVAHGRNAVAFQCTKLRYWKVLWAISRANLNSMHTHQSYLWPNFIISSSVKSNSCQSHALGYLQSVVGVWTLLCLKLVCVFASIYKSVLSSGDAWMRIIPLTSAVRLQLFLNSLQMRSAVVKWQIQVISLNGPILGPILWTAINLSGV